MPDVIVGTSIGAVRRRLLMPRRKWTIWKLARTLTVRGVLSYLDISLSGSGLIGGGPSCRPT